MRTKRTSGANYLTPLAQGSTSTTRARRKNPAVVLLLALLALTCLISTLSFMEPSQSLIAYADDDCDDAADCEEKGLDNAWDASGVDGTDEGFSELLENSRSEDYDSKSIAYAIKRHFTVGYLNNGAKANIGKADDDDNPLKWYKEIFDDRGKWNCGNNYGGKSDVKHYPGEEEGAIYWHNCDVPNLITEFAQDIASIVFDPNGFSGASAQSSVTSTPWFGYSSNTPEEVNQNGTLNITGLEAFGYNLQYTSYRGEWDRIKVMNSARALSNFGFMDRLKLGVQAWANGLMGGLDAAVDGFMDDLKSGNIAVMITAPLRIITNFFKGATATAINTIIDTSDTNIFATYGWYRPDFGATLYNARELSQDEVSDYIQAQLAKFLIKMEQDREKAKPPEDLAAVSPEKLKAIALPSPGRCSKAYVFTNKADTSNVKNAVISSTEYSNEQACLDSLAAKAEASYPVADWTHGSPVGPQLPTFQPERTVADWSAEANWESTNEKYQIYCSIATSQGSSTSSNAVTIFLACMEDPKIGYPAAVARETKNEQSILDNSLTAKWMQQSKISDFLRKEATSFTAPSAKYICLDANGKDMLDGEGRFVRLVTGKPGKFEYNEKCLLDGGVTSVREPVQNGLFGNGYIDRGSAPVDTRRSVFSPSFLDIIPHDDLVNNAGLTISKFTTRVSNTVLNLSFSPILSEFGADKIIATMIEGFRDSLFFPLSVLVIALGALSIFFQAGTRRDYGAQAKSLLLIVVTFFAGALLLADPERTIHWVDQGPAHAEAVVIGSIFTLDGEEDGLCAAVSPSASGVDFFGNNVTYDPAAASRNILCENWRVFALTPYIYGQWGTSYESLNSENFSASGDVNTRVTSNEGGRVYLGANNAINNWGLYQIDTLTQGTSTTYDPNPSKGTPADMYRIVDLQAGPDNGANTNSTYFNSWAGDNPGQRMLVSLLGAIVSIFGMVTIILFGYAKIYISMMSMLMLLFLPFMFLIGLFPNQGRFKLKGYILQLLSYMALRIILVAMIAILMRILIAVGTSSDSFFQYAIITIAICMAFILNRKEIMNLFESSIVGSTGGFGKDFNFSDYTPRFVRQRAQGFTRGMKAGGYAAVGGYMTGGAAGAKDAFTHMRRYSEMNSNERFAREGFGLTGNMLQGRKAAKQDSQDRYSKYLNSKLGEETRDEILQKLRQDPEFNKLDPLAQRKLIEAEVNESMKGMLDAPRSVRKAANRLNAAEDKLGAPRDSRSNEDLLGQIRRTSATTNLTGDFADIESHGQKPSRTANEKQAARLDKAVEGFEKASQKAYGKDKRALDARHAASQLTDDAALGLARKFGSAESELFVLEDAAERVQRHNMEKANLQASAQTMMQTFTESATDDIAFVPKAEEVAEKKAEKQARREEKRTANRTPNTPPAASPLAQANSAIADKQAELQKAIMANGADSSQVKTLADEIIKMKNDLRAVGTPSDDSRNGEQA